MEKDRRTDQELVAAAKGLVKPTVINLVSVLHIGYRRAERILKLIHAEKS